MSTGAVNLVRLHQVSRNFPLGETTVNALDEVSLTLTTGEFLAVWGPSDSGNIIGLIDAPTSGEVWCEGEDTRRLADTTLTDFRGSRIARIRQFFNRVRLTSKDSNIIRGICRQFLWHQSLAPDKLIKEDNST